MRRRARRSGAIGGTKASIDMNSLIDLTFLLLVTFILTIPALEQGISIMLPRAKAEALPHKKHKTNTISMDIGHRVYLNNVPITLDDLKADIKAKVAEDPDVPVLVRADERLEYGEVMAVVKILHDNKVHRMSLVTENK